MVDDKLHEHLLDRIEVELALRGRSLTAGKREYMRSVLVRIDRAKSPREADALRKELERELLVLGQLNENLVCAPDTGCALPNVAETQCT